MAVPDFLLTLSLFEDRAQSSFVIDQTEPVRAGKLLDLCFPIFLVCWPDTLQFIFINGAVAILASLQLQFAFNQSSENFHNHADLETASYQRLRKIPGCNGEVASHAFWQMTRFVIGGLLGRAKPSLAQVRRWRSASHRLIPSQFGPRVFS